MIARPELPDATVIGFGKITLPPPIRVALLLPLESPMVIVPLPLPPKALATVPSTVPDRIERPPVKVFTPDNVS